MMSLLRKIGAMIIPVLLSGSGLLAQPYIESRSLSFNTSSVEFAPAFYKSGLVFCSDRVHELFPMNVDMNNKQFLNLYKVEQKRPGKFGSPELFSKELTTYLNDGPACFSKDGKTVYFTRNIDVSKNKRNGQREDSTFGIFSAELVKDKWVNITAFRYNRPDTRTGYPCLSDDGKQLFFCSDSHEGFGGFDMYVCQWENGHWGQPQNLGSNVNTDKNEVFPFLHQSGRLYFASRGHHSRGDLDIYYTVNIDGVWQKPVALEAPYNSPKDDYGIILNAAMDTGYFVSDRDGTPDIFSAYSSIPTYSVCKPQEENEYCFVFYEPNNNELDTASMAYEWDLGDGTKVRKLQAEHCYSKTGVYLVQLNVVDKLTNEVALNQASDSFLVEDIEQPFITMPDTVTAGQELTLDGHKTFLKNFKIGAYDWDFDDGFRSTGVQVKHAYHYPGTYTVKLGVTEMTGDPKKAALQKCSTRRIVVVGSRK
jgi:hypothetical protein